MKQILIAKRDKICDIGGELEVMPQGSVFIVLEDSIKFTYPISKGEHARIFTLISSRGICTSFVEDFALDWYFEEIIK